MSQPPYGNQPPPYGSPPPYGGSQPGWGAPQTGGQPVYGSQPTQQFGAPAGGGGGFGYPPSAPPPYGSGPGGPYGYGQPPKKSPVPWIIGGLVLLLVAGGIGLFFILSGDEDPSTVASTTSVQATETTEETTEESEQSEESEESEQSRETEMTTQDSEEPDSGGSGQNFPASQDIALDFVNALVGGDFVGAHSLLCAGGQAAVDPQGLADDFFVTLGSTTILGGGISGVAPDGVDDVVSFDIETDVGVVFLDVLVIEESGILTICGFATV